jgi:hypothetical protein
MSYLIYNENESKGEYSGPPINSLNPNTQFRKHLENWFFLKLTLRNGNMIDRHKASKELAICDRKLEFWRKKRSFDEKQAERDVAELRSRWQEPETPEARSLWNREN